MQQDILRSLLMKSYRHEHAVRAGLPLAGPLFGASTIFFFSIMNECKARPLFGDGTIFLANSNMNKPYTERAQH
jgi:hypothetical protein